MRSHAAAVAAAVTACKATQSSFAGAGLCWQQPVILHRHRDTQRCSPCCLPPFPPCCCCLFPFFCCLGAASCSAVAATSADAALGRKLLHHRLLLLLLLVPVMKAAAGVAGLTWGAALSMAAAGLLLRALPKAPCRQAGLMLLQTASSWRSGACTFLHQHRHVTYMCEQTCAGASATQPGCQACAAAGGAAAAGSTAGPDPLYAASHSLLPSGAPVYCGMLHKLLELLRCGDSLQHGTYTRRLVFSQGAFIGRQLVTCNPWRGG